MQAPAGASHAAPRACRPPARPGRRPPARTACKGQCACAAAARNRRPSPPPQPSPAPTRRLRRPGWASARLALQAVREQVEHVVPALLGRGVRGRAAVAAARPGRAAERVEREHRLAAVPGGRAVQRRAAVAVARRRVAALPRRAEFVSPAGVGSGLEIGAGARAGGARWAGPARGAPGAQARGWRPGSPRRRPRAAASAPCCPARPPRSPARPAPRSRPPARARGRRSPPAPARGSRAPRAQGPARPGAEARLVVRGRAVHRRPRVGRACAGRAPAPGHQRAQQRRLARHRRHVHRHPAHRAPHHGQARPPQVDGLRQVQPGGRVRGASALAGGGGAHGPCCVRTSAPSAPCDAVGGRLGAGHSALRARGDPARPRGAVGEPPVRGRVSGGGAVGLGQRLVARRQAPAEERAQEACEVLPGRVGRNSVSPRCGCARAEWARTNSAPQVTRRLPQPQTPRRL